MSRSTQGVLSPIATSPSVFNFESHAVRIIMFEGEPWFVATDVCRALKLSNPSKATASLDEDERSNLKLDRGGSLVVVSESGMYTLALRCRDAVKPNTVPHRFRKWITSEVLPSLRRTGGYGTPQRTIEAQALAAAISQRVFQTLMQSEGDLRTQRWNVRFDRDNREQDLNVQITPIPSNAYIMSFAKLARNIEMGEVGCAASDVELLAIASACTDRVARRMQRR
ncbi:BRO-N domain-containing protein [Alcaligenes sp. HNGD-HTN06]|uniref:BRO-N domain-containing protein n=1 Tax=Alcaligenes sp. HNGD-HTN06 TaxID=3416924 RepID=UPI003CED4D08